MTITTKICAQEMYRKKYLRNSWSLQKHDMPVVIHDREAHGDMLEILQQYRPKGVVHCFSGSTEMSREILKLGMYIGIGGVVTFKNARHIVEVTKELPLDRLLLETDYVLILHQCLCPRRTIPPLFPILRRELPNLKEFP